MTKSTEGFRSNQSVPTFTKLTTVTIAFLLASFAERLTAQVCPQLPIFGGETAFEWDQGFPSNRIVSFCTSVDRHTMYFDQRGGGPIWKTQRAAIDLPWSSPAEVPWPVTSGQLEHLPTLSPDGRWLYFTSFRENAWEIYAATRTDPDVPVAPFDHVVKLDSVVNSDFLTWAGCLSSDGRELYYISGTNWDLWVALFNVPGDPEMGFMEPRPLTVLNTADQLIRPTISSDGTTLFFSDRPQNWQVGAPPRPGGIGRAISGSRRVARSLTVRSVRGGGPRTSVRSTRPVTSTRRGFQPTGAP